MGIPYKMKDKIDLELRFDGPLTLDYQGYVKPMSKYPGSSDMIVSIAWSFA